MKDKEKLTKLKSGSASPNPEGKGDEKVEEDEQYNPSISLTQNAAREHVWEDHEAKQKKPWEQNTRDARANTWYLRYDKHKEDKKTEEAALKKARQEKLKNAIKYLVSQGGVYAELKYIAQFLYSNETLDKKEVGEFLSSLDSSVLNEKQHEGSFFF